jgi:glycosyltransferase involved in cell wall biosynthesis
LGWRSYETLPAYQKGLDVCLLPYLLNEYTRNVHPNKLHQYLAGGKPIVSTDMPEMRPFADVIAIARDHKEFLGLVEQMLQNGSNPLMIERRIAVAQENSVEKRAEVKIALLNVALEQYKRNR